MYLCQYIYIYIYRYENEHIINERNYIILTMKFSSIDSILV